MAAKKAVRKTGAKAAPKRSHKKAAPRTSTRRPATGKKVARKAAKKPAQKKAVPRKVAKKKAPKKTAQKKAVTRKAGKKKAAVKKVVKKRIASKTASAKTRKRKAVTVAKKTRTKTRSTAKKAADKRRPSKKRITTKRSPVRARRGGAGKPNLLSGPVRGFDPYRPTRGESYMNEQQLAHFRQLLDAWKTELMEEVDRTMLHMKDDAANFPDPSDRATQESEFGLELRTRDRERKLLKKIASALQRVEGQTYGYCEETGEEIGLRRLEARPVATLCVEAQERRERAEKQYRDREDYYR